MYNNLSQKLKTLAICVLIVEVVAGLILGIWLCSINEEYVLGSIFFMILNFLAAWIFSCVLYALGLILEKTESVENDTKRLQRSVKKRTSDVKTAPNHVEDISNNRVDTADNEQELDQDAPATAIRTNTNTIVCSKCHYEQPGQRTFCWHCGAKFE